MRVTLRSASGIPERCQLPARLGSCKASLLRWWYNADAGQCEKFFFGACAGNENNFETKELCEQTCSEHKSNQRRWRRSSSTKEHILYFTGPVCERPRFRGPCEQAITRFYFDPEEKSCRRFRYSGCRSNLNNFRTEKACMEACAPPKLPPRKPY